MYKSESSDAVYHVNDEDDFNAQVKSAGSKLVIVDFFAIWCHPCTLIAPHLERLAKQYESEVTVLKVDVEENEDLAMARFKVNSMPTFVFMKNGKEVERYSGATPQKLEASIKKHTA